MGSVKSILFVVPYPYGKAPSQRFRFEQYLSYLREEGFKFEISPFLDYETWDIFYKKGNFIPILLGILKAFIKRLFLLFGLSKFEFIFIHREATMAGPPWFEWLVAKALKKRIIYDFDDAIWMHQFGKGEFVKEFIKYPQKVNKIISWSYKVSAGNAYLYNHAVQFNKNVILNPTTIDTVNHHNQFKDQDSPKFVIGWTGTHSTLCHLETKIHLIKELERELDFEFCVIANTKPQWALKSLHFIPWNKETEIEDLLNFNIGLMPLQPDEWTEGKCGFKALQYMALGIPAIVSPVGVNKTIINDNVNGFICERDEEWLQAIRSLYFSVENRKRMGIAAREKVVNEFSVLSNRENFLSLFS